MHKMAKFCAFAMVFTISASTAWSQDEDMGDDMGDESMDDEGMGEDEGMDEGDGMEEGDTAAAEPAAPAEMGAMSGVGPFTKAGYPQSLIDRPLTLPKGMIELQGRISHAALSIMAGGVTVSGDATALLVGGSYGVMDKLTVSAATGLGLDPDVKWIEEFNLGALYLVHDSAKLDVAAGAQIPLQFGEGEDVLPGVVLEAPTRFLATDKVFVFGGNGLLPIAFDPSAINLNLNVGGGFQATPELAVAIDTQLASVAISGDGNETTTLGDFIPLGISGLYAISNMLDVVATVELPSVEDAADFYVISAGANFRL